MKKNNKKIKNVFLGHTLEEYKAIYDIEKTIHIDKSAINEFNKTHKEDPKDSPLEGRLWWLIGDTYYEVNSINHKINKHKKNKGPGFKIALTSILGGIGIVGALGGGGYIMYRAMQQVEPEPAPTYDNFKFDNNKVSAKDTSISGKIVIPEKNPNTGETITEIGSFSDCKLITEVELPNTIKKTNMYSFSHCESLVKINLPSGFETLGEDTFEHCYSLSSITIPSTIKEIKNRAFGICPSLKEVIIDSQVAIDELNNTPGTFEYKSTCLFHYADKVYINSSINYNILSHDLKNNFKKTTSEKTGYDLYESNDNLFFEPAYDNTNNTNRYYRPKKITTSTVTVPSDDGQSHPVFRIMPFAYANNTTLTEITIPTTITMLGMNDDGYVFANDTNLQKVTFSGEDMTYSFQLLKYCFYNCSSLTDIKIPNITGDSSTGSIEQNAFEGCIALQKINMPEKITQIYNDAFKNCTNLNSITIDSTYVGKLVNNDSQLFTNVNTIYLKNTITIESGEYIYDHYNKTGTQETYNIYTKNN